MQDTKSAQIIELARAAIQTEADTLLDLLPYINANFVGAVMTIHNASGKLIVTGVGKSAIIGQKIVATLNSTGSTAIFLHAADAIHGDLGVANKDDVALALTKSGETEELKKLWPFLQQRVQSIITMAANPDSFAANNANYFLYTPVNKEADPNNLAPTSSSISQLAMGDALAICLQELGNFRPADFAELHPGGSLGKLLNLRVEQLLEAKQWPKVHHQTNIREVIYEISRHRLGATAVVDQGGMVTGIITDGDLRRMLQSHSDPLILSAENIMTTEPISIFQTSLAKSAVDKMRTNKINHLIVYDDRNKYRGILHIQDLLKQGLM